MAIDWFSVYAPIYDPFVRLMRIAPAADLLKLAQLRPHETVLDLGGGTGRIASSAVRLCKEVVVLDACTNMLKRVPSHPRLQVVQGQAQSMPFDGGLFDVVLCVDALHHIKDAPATIQEIHRVLKPGGRVLVQEFNVHSWRGKIVKVFELLFVDRSQFLSPNTLKDLFLASGIHGATRPHSWLEYTFMGVKA